MTTRRHNQARLPQIPFFILEALEPRNVPAIDPIAGSDFTYDSDDVELAPLQTPTGVIITISFSDDVELAPLQTDVIITIPFKPRQVYRPLYCGYNPEIDSAANDEWDDETSEDDTSDTDDWWGDESSDDEWDDDTSDDDYWWDDETSDADDWWGDESSDDEWDVETSDDNYWWDDETSDGDDWWDDESSVDDWDDETSADDYWQDEPLDKQSYGGGCWFEGRNTTVEWTMITSDVVVWEQLSLVAVAKSDELPGPINDEAMILSNYDISPQTQQFAPILPTHPGKEMLDSPDGLGLSPDPDTLA